MHYRHRRSSNVIFSIIVGLLMICFFPVVLYGYFNNIVNVVSKYPPIKEWQGSHIVCSAGVLVAPVGIVCGVIDAGVPE